MKFKTFINNQPVLFYSGLFLIIISILLYAIKIIVTSSYSEIDYRGYGEIGDVIGGISAPFINLLGAILVFISFREQKRSNDLVFAERKYYDYLNEFNNLKEDFKELEHNVTEDGIPKSRRSIAGFMFFLSTINVFRGTELHLDNYYIEISHFFKRYKMLYEKLVIEISRSKINELTVLKESMDVYYSVIFKKTVTNNANILLDAETDFEDLIQLHFLITGEKLKRNQIKDLLKDINI